LDGQRLALPSEFLQLYSEIPWASAGAEAARAKSKGQSELAQNLVFAQRPGEPKWPLVSKWRHYLEIYDSRLARFRETDVNVVELGIAHGGSLRLWRAYFGQQAHLFGLDIAPSTKKYVKDPMYGSPDKVVIGDEADSGFWDRVQREIPRIDVFIDDGGHRPGHQQLTLERVLSMLAPGGVYIVEDIIEQSFVKSVVDRFLLGSASLNRFVFKPKLIQRNLTEPQRQLFSVSFFPFVIVIEKLHDLRTVFYPDERGVVKNRHLDGHG
jgi:hypothetical protein